MSKRTLKPQIHLSLEEMQAIDEWRFENRLPSRAAAIRALIRRGLEREVSDKRNNKEATDDSEPSRQMVHANI
ncbi:ribbon-helix-helix protein, CopG family [Hyphococcus sp.]|uniref:ribbon-helix-helix protein, CopG family n=1 Tax=Hyphococcus sp. TaxID=2038636 RepID=UPI003CCBD7EC